MSYDDDDGVRVVCAIASASVDGEDALSSSMSASDDDNTKHINTTTQMHEYIIHTYTI